MQVVPTHATQLVEFYQSPRRRAARCVAFERRLPIIPADLRRTLLDCGRELGLGARVNAAVYRICIEDPPIAAVAPAEIDNLRYGLNAIARWLR